MSVSHFPAKEGWMCSGVQLLGHSPPVSLISLVSESWLCGYGERQVKECAGESVWATSMRAVPGRDVLRWGRRSLLVLLALALALFVWRRLGGSDPLPSRRNNLLAAPSSAVVHGPLLPARFKPLVADLRMLLPM